MDPSHFRKIKKIGRGGFSTVWKVKSKTNSEFFAMKKIRKDRIVAKRCVESVLNERRFLSVLKHPLIANMHYAFQTEKSLYLIMDYLKGGDLRYALGNSPAFSEKQVKFFVCCVLSAIEYVHSKGIIHGDIKPENLVFDNEGYLRLTDFGIARTQVPNNASETAGTPKYMAPEILFRQNHTVCSDYYSIGVLLFELISKKKPFDGNTRDEIRAAVSAGTPQLDAPTWSKNAIDLTYKLLSTDPQQRIGFYGTQEVKEHPWLCEFNWKALLNREINPPFVPKDTDNFYKTYVHRGFTTFDNPNTKLKEGLFDEYAYNQHYQQLVNCD